MTSLSLPAARRRFLAMLWLSAALHALVIGLTRLPPPLKVPASLEIEARLTQVAAAPAAAQPQPLPAPLARKPLPPQAVVQAPSALPEPVAPPVPQPPAAGVPEAPLVTAEQNAPGPQLDIPLMADPRYYPAKELDSPPVPVRKPQPVYPPQAAAQGISGHVLLRLHLEADGEVSKAEAIEVSPAGVFGEMFKQAALDSTRGLRFLPARRNGQPVRALLDFKIVFERED